MIEYGWLVCSECEGSGWVSFGSYVIECPDCDGTGDPPAGDSDEDDEDSEGHIGPVGYDAFDFADDR